jgi:hypothetical protein
MITREKLSHGEGELVEGDPEIGSRKRTSQSEKMASEEGLSQNEREFQKTFFAMSEMVKVLYDDYLEWKRPVQGESSKQDKSEEGEDPPKPPPSPPSSHHLLLLQVQVQILLLQENILINISLTCHYLNLM